MDEVKSNWPSAKLGVHHRIGRLALGEASIIIVAASPHRGDAFAACRYTIERVKADRADLEARALRRRRRLVGGRHGGPGRRNGPPDGVSHRMRVTVRLFARLRDLAGAGEMVRDVPAPATIEQVWRSLVKDMPGARRLRAHDVGGAEHRLLADDRGGEGRRRGGVPAAGVGRMTRHV
jgi:hypothetical protein